MNLQNQDVTSFHVFKHKINGGLTYNYVKSDWKGTGDHTIFTDLFDRLKFQQHEIA